jgi:hypothetical protein
MYLAYFFIKTVKQYSLKKTLVTPNSISSSPNFGSMLLIEATISF